MKRTMTTAGLTALGVSAMLVAGCNKESNQTAPVASQSGGSASTAPESGKAANENDQALVRVISAAPDAADGRSDRRQEPGLHARRIQRGDAYKALPANFDDFTVKAAGQDTAAPLAENSESIVSGRHYTLVIFPDAPRRRPMRRERRRARSSRST